RGRYPWRSRVNCSDCPWKTADRPHHRSLVADALEKNRTSGGDGPKVCISTQATPFQVVEVVKRYLEHHPQERQFVAVGLATKALVAAFPSPMISTSAARPWRS